MAKNAEQFSEVSERAGTTKNEERDTAGAGIVKEWGQLLRGDKINRTKYCQ